MKVKELIKLLEERNQNAEVVIFCNNIPEVDDAVELEIESVFDTTMDFVALNCLY